MQITKLESQDLEVIALYRSEQGSTLEMIQHFTVSLDLEKRRRRTIAEEMELSRLAREKQARWNLGGRVEETVEKWKEGDYGVGQDGINNAWGLVVRSTEQFKITKT